MRVSFFSIERVRVPGFQQHEKNEVIQGIRDLTAQLRDMKNYVNEIFTRSYNIEQKLGGGVPVQTGGGAAAGGQVAQAGLDAHTRQYLENIQNEVRQIRAGQLSGQPVHGGAGGAGAGQGGTLPLCPDVSCTSSTLFLSVALLQAGVIIAFVFLR